MNIRKSRNLAIAISILLAFSMTASMMLMPAARASSNIPVYAYINVSPNPTGVGQGVEIIMWVNVIFGGTGGPNAAAIPNDYRFHNYQLVITAPGGTNTTETFATVEDSTSAQDYYYTPETTGTYMLTFIFPATLVTASNDGAGAPLIGDTYLPTTATTNLTVQSAPIAGIPQTPLPTAYWTRPIYGENTAWYTLGSNWLGDGSPGYVALGLGPNLGGNGEEFGPTTNVGSLTSHVMWTMPLTSGGIVGQTATTITGNSYAEGSAYDQKYTNPIIVDGMLIFTEPISQTEPSGGPTVCVNLQTGKTIWTSTTTGTPSHPVPSISFAYVYDAEDPNQHGVWPPMLVGSVAGSWQFYDAFTGDYLFTLTNIPDQGFFGIASNAAAMMGPEGEFLMTSLVNYGTPTSPNWYLQEWNSSRIWDNDYSGESTTPVIPPPITNATNPSLYDFNVSLPWLNTATLNGANIGSMSVYGGIQGDELLALAGTLPNPGTFVFAMTAVSENPYEWFGINLNSSIGTVGTEIFHNTLQAPAGNLTVLWAGIDPVNNVFAVTYRETMQFVGYSLTTGQQVWGPTPEQAALDYYGSDASGSISDTVAYGNIYSSAYAGILYCYSTKTGDLLWTFGNGNTPDNSTNSGVETPFGNYPTFVNAVGNGVVYLVTTEHTEETPIFKGAVVRAVNATTGQQIWTLSAYVGEFLYNSYAMADGYNTWFNGYDNQVYTVGRGPSQTTVNAGPKVTTLGDNVVISGTVMDVSTGTQQTQQAGDFPNGVPVASDASMAAWMGYVYQQQPEPTTFTGVPVTISVTDSNHNTRVIGTTMTDESGMYTLTWAPDITGNYTVTAVFAGTNGYWPSSDQTSFNIMSAPPTTAPTATPLTGIASNTTVEYIGVAIIIVIVIIGVVLAMLVTRKHA
jgi:hypothetical protein